MVCIDWHNWRGDEERGSNGDGGAGKVEEDTLCRIILQEVPSNEAGHRELIFIISLFILLDLLVNNGIGHTQGVHGLVETISGFLRVDDDGKGEGKTTVFTPRVGITSAAAKSGAGEVLPLIELIAVVKLGSVALLGTNVITLDGTFKGAISSFIFRDNLIQLPVVAGGLLQGGTWSGSGQYTGKKGKE